MDVMMRDNEQIIRDLMFISRAQHDELLKDPVLLVSLIDDIKENINKNGNFIENYLKTTGRFLAVNGAWAPPYETNLKRLSSLLNAARYYQIQEALEL